MKRKPGRPIVHKVSQLIAEERLDEARDIVQRAIWQGGSVRAAARILACSTRTLWRYCETLGLGSFYDGSQGGMAMVRRFLTESSGMKYEDWLKSIRMFK